MVNCKEFMNADNIPAGLSPFNPEDADFEVGRIMLQRVRYLLSLNG
jgi:predicted ABC-type ATPase